MEEALSYPGKIGDESRRFLRGRAIAGWALICLIAVGLFSAEVGAPLLRWSGHTNLAAIIYGAFSHVCHQMASRSFHIEGYPMAVCARCTGIYGGFALVALFYPLAASFRRPLLLSRIWLFLAAIPLAVDFLVGFLNIWENTAWSRFSTGFLLGGVASLYVVSGAVEIAQSMTVRPKLFR